MPLPRKSQNTAIPQYKYDETNPKKSYDKLFNTLLDLRRGMGDLEGRLNKLEKKVDNANRSI